MKENFASLGVLLKGINRIRVSVGEKKGKEGSSVIRRRAFYLCRRRVVRRTRPDFVPGAPCPSVFVEREIVVSLSFQRPKRPRRRSRRVRRTRARRVRCPRQCRLTVRCAPEDLKKAAVPCAEPSGVVSLTSNGLMRLSGGRRGGRAFRSGPPETRKNARTEARVRSSGSCCASCPPCFMEPSPAPLRFSTLFLCASMKPTDPSEAVLAHRIDARENMGQNVKAGEA